MEKLKLLVVDDETGMRLAIERALTDYKFQFPYLSDPVGFTVQLAATGEEALEFIESASPDILLLDHKLPGLSGLDLLKKLTKDDSRMLTVMITAYASIETAITAIKLGAFDFLAKPFTPDELKASVQRTAKHLLLQRQAHNAAREKRKLRFELISLVSHELKSPLTAIAAYLDIMRGQTLGPDLQSYQPIITRCQARTQGMTKLISDLLDLTRLESGNTKRNLIACDLWEIAQRVIENNRAAAEERTIRPIIQGSQPLLMRADPGELEIIFNNLISNAIKYNRDAGTVIVRLEKVDRQITISISDSGIGLTPDEAAVLFNDFVRIKNEKTQNIFGSGLGLSIVKKIALLYEGKVEVQSQPDQGSSFIITLQEELADA